MDLVRGAPQLCCCCMVENDDDDSETTDATGLAYQSSMPKVGVVCVTLRPFLNRIDLLISNFGIFNCSNMFREV